MEVVKIECQAVPNDARYMYRDNSELLKCYGNASKCFVEKILLLLNASVVYY